jgi:signal transduction histidine kinase
MMTTSAGETSISRTRLEPAGSPTLTDMRTSRFAPLATAARALALMALLLWVVVASTGATRPALVVGCGLAATGSLLVGPRWPVLPPAVATAALIVANTAGGLPADGRSDSPFLLMLIWSVFVAGRHAAPRWQPWNAAMGLLYVAMVASNPGANISEVVFPAVIYFGPWLAGLSVQTLTTQAERARSWAAEAEAARETSVRNAILEERLDIARELHDIVAHRISAVSLQAQVARRQAEAGLPVSPDQMRTIEVTAQQSMADMRRLLGLLRPEDGAATLDPQASLADLPHLLETADASGQRVDFEQSGQARALAPAASLAAYRIVQEALTNARRHGGHGVTRVRMAWSDSTLHIEVTNPVRMDQPPVHPGHGIHGMAERAQLFGGTLTSGVEGDRWAVRAVLPAPVVVQAAAQAAAL